MPDDEKDLKEWCTGFFNAEGHIETSFNKQESTSLGYRFKYRIGVSQSEVSGMFDGDGNIQVGIAERERGFDWAASPSIHFSNSCPEAILRFCSYCESLGIETNPKSRTRKNKNAAPNWNVRFGSKEDVRKFLTEVRGDLCFRKRMQANIMINRILPIIDRGDHLNKEGFLELIAWVDELKKFKGARESGTEIYNLEFFEDLWDMELPRDRRPTDDDIVEIGGLFS